MYSKTFVWLLLAILLPIKQKSAFEIRTNCKNCFYSLEEVKRDLVSIPELESTLEANSKTASDYFQRPVVQIKEEIRMYTEFQRRFLCFSKVKHPELNGYTSNFISDYFENPKAYPEFNTFPHIKLSIIEIKHRNHEILYSNLNSLTLDIDCTHFGLTDMSTLNTSLYDLIPNLNLVHLNELSLKNCTFPDEPFQALFRILNTTEILTLKISDSPSKFNLSIPWNYKLNHVELINNTGLNRVDADLSQVALLRLRGIEITSLNPDMFNNLGNLKTLNIGQNNISNSDLVLFEHLKTLKTFKIDNNRLVSPPSALFRNIPYLDSLDISNNNIRTLHTGEFKALTKLNYLNIRGNKLTTLEPGVFQHLKNLERLNLDHNDISNLDPHTFQDLTSLKELKIDNNQLVSLTSALFINTPDLRSLDASGNHISVLPRKLFEGCRKLSKLDLSHNELKSIEDNQFAFLEELENLNLSGNQLETFTRGMFKGTRTIGELDLSHNKLKSIGELAFGLCKRNHALSSIDLSYNSLEMSSDSELSPLNECKRLQTLKLSNNRINKIYKDWILNIPSLRMLDLKWNNIKRMPNYESADYKTMSVSSKMILDISYNQIEVIEWSLLKLLGQRRIYKTLRNKIVLNGNPIACDCSNYDLFSSIQNMSVVHVADVLEKVDIETQNITCKPGNTSLDRVHPREIACGNVEGCPPSCECTHFPYHNETTVNCSTADLRQVPQELNITYEGKTASKIRLILTNNSIEDFLQNPPVSYKLVTDLDLSLNEISHWRTDIMHYLPQLSQLNLSYNHLKSLSQDFINNLSTSNIGSLSLSANPWACDCDNITRLYDFFWNKQMIFKDSIQITCNDGKESLLEVNLNDFCPSNNHQEVIVVSLILGGLGILFGLLVVFYYKYQHEIKVWLFTHGILLFCVSQEDLDTDKVYDAFVSYAIQDYGFVVHSLLPELDRSFKICHHERDFVAGEWIHNQIQEKVEQSRRTIIVLTEHFLNSFWGMTEFRVAHAQALRDNCARVIILILGEMPPQEAIPEEMKAYMSMNTYIKWGDTWFWDKLKYALPHPPSKPIHEFPLAEFNDQQ